MGAAVTSTCMSGRSVKPLTLELQQKGLGDHRQAQRQAAATLTAAT